MGQRIPSAEEVAEQRKRVRGWFNLYRPGRNVPEGEVTGLLQNYGGLEDIRKAIEAEPADEMLSRRADALKRRAETETASIFGEKRSALLRRKELMGEQTRTAETEIPNIYSGQAGRMNQSQEQTLSALNTARANTEKYYNDLIERLRMQQGQAGTAASAQELQYQVNRLEQERTSRLSDYERNIAEAKGYGAEQQQEILGERDRRLNALKAMSGLSERQTQEELLGLEEIRPQKTAELYGKYYEDLQKELADKETAEFDKWYKRESLAQAARKLGSEGDLTDYQKGQLGLAQTELGSIIAAREAETAYIKKKTESLGKTKAKKPFTPKQDYDLTKTFINKRMPYFTSPEDLASQLEKELPNYKNRAGAIKAIKEAVLTLKSKSPNLAKIPWKGWVETSPPEAKVKTYGKPKKTKTMLQQIKGAFE